MTPFRRGFISGIALMAAFFTFVAHWPCHGGVIGGSVWVMCK